MTKDIIEKALNEATLRLAWYLKTYGGIPVAEFAKLTLAGHGLRNDELLDDARVIKEQLLSICSPEG
jgi:hypothetical protein